MLITYRNQITGIEEILWNIPELGLKNATFQSSLRVCVPHFLWPGLPSQTILTWGVSPKEGIVQGGSQHAEKAQRNNTQAAMR